LRIEWPFMSDRSTERWHVGFRGVHWSHCS
jgi:hypothetical protein